MIVEMRKGATKEEVDAVVQKAKSLDLGVQLNIGTDKTVVALLGSNTGQIDQRTSLPFSPAWRASPAS